MEAQQDTGAFVIAGSFGMDVTGAAVSDIHAELERITSTPLTAEELANAKNFLMGYYLLDVGVPATFANLLATNYLLGLPWEAVNKYVGNIEAVTAEEVQSAAQQYMEVEQPIIVIVGDAQVIEPQLEGLGDVVVVDVHGEPVE